MNKVGSRALVGALTVAMVAPSALAPISQAVAAEAPAIERVTVDTSFSGAAQRIIKGDDRMTAEELKAAIDEAAKALDAAKQDAARAEGAGARQATVVANAKQSYDGASAAASQADAAKVAELERQIEALNAELAAAQQKVEDLQAQSSDASAALEGLEADKAEAEKDQTQAQTALDEANEALKEAQAALDALGENPTADEQAAYDAAKKAYDEAVADQQAKQQAADEAKAALDRLDAELASKQGELATAQSDLASKQAAKQQADEALATAKANYAATVEAIKGELVAEAKAALEAATGEQANAQAAYDAVKDGEDEGAIAEAKAALDAANEKLGAAQTAYDGAVATAGAEAEAEASAAIQEKQTAADNAAAALAEVENKIATLPGQIEGIDAQIASEQAKVTEAEGARDEATELVNQKQEAFDIAAAALKNLAEAQRQWDEKAAPLQEAVDAAKQGVADAEAALDTAQQKVADLKSQITAKQAEIDRVQDMIDHGTTQMIDDFGDFLTWADANGYLEDDYVGTTELELLQGWSSSGDGFISNFGYVMSGENPANYPHCGVSFKDADFIQWYTHMGDKNDASSLTNVLKALDSIDAANELREEAGLEPLKVTYLMTAVSILNANWSKYHFDQTHELEHAQTVIANTPSNKLPYGMNVAENLAYGSNDPVSLWASEKDDWEKFCQETYGTVPAAADTYDFYREHRSDPAMQQAFATCGHYINLMSDRYEVTGAAYTKGMSSQVYNWENNIATNKFYGMGFDADSYDKHRFTTDQFRDLIELAMNSGISATADNGSLVEQLEQLKSQLAELEGQKAAAEGEVADAQNGVTSANETLTQANNNLAAIGARPTEDGLQAAYDKAQQELNDAKKQQSEADQNLTNVTSEVNQKVEELNGRKTELEGQLTNAKGQLEGLRDASEEAKRQLEETKASYKSLTDAATALDNAQANAAEADDAYDKANTLVDDLDAQIEALNTQVETAENDYDQKKAAAEAAGPTTEQTEALDDAKAALEAKRQQVAQLERDRDAAKNTADEAAAAKAEVDALVDAIMADIEEQTGIKQAAEAALPQAQAKADAWSAALPDADAAKDAVTGGGTSDDADVKAALDAAHLAYEEKAVLAEMAADRLAEAKAAYEAALKDKDATAAELAEKKAALADAQAAYDELVALLPEEKPEQPEVTPGKPGQGTEQGSVTQAGYDVAAPEATAKAAQSGDDLPQTGDATGAMIAGVVLAGMAAMGAGAHFRRRNQL